MGAEPSERTAPPSAMWHSKPHGRYAVTVLGRAARRALARPGRWRVLAAFRRSFYAEDDHGALVCVGGPSIGDGPLTVRCALPDGTNWEAGFLRPGTPAECDGGTLSVDRRLAFDLAAASEWRPHPVPRDWEPVMLGPAARALAADVTARRPRDGLAPLIPLLASLPTDATTQTLLTRMALPAVRSLAEWLESARVRRHSAMSALPSDLEPLIGLGPGLTPSGDDLLGGALIALHALGRSDMAEPLGAWLGPRARGRTPSISLAHLACAAEGEGMAALHEVLSALGAPDSLLLRRALDGLDAIGHTSGWDALAGAWLVVSVLAGMRLSRRAASLSRRAARVR